jgi:L-threonylcarbamoyladenylate synthase
MILKVDSLSYFLSLLPYERSMIISDIKIAIQALQQGDVVAIPTETVYGLAGNAENEEAIKKIFTLKNRPFSHPLIMHVGKGWDLSQWVLSIPDYANTLIEKFWPGPLTLVFHAKPSNVSPYVYAHQTTIAIRCPAHPIAQAILQELKAPLAAPSANPFGKISPTISLHVEESFGLESLLVLEGGRCNVGIESTIVAALDNESYTVLRHGSIDEASIKRALPGLSQTVCHIPAPGRLESHYQPEKPLLCFENDALILEFCQSNPDVYALVLNDKPEYKELNLRTYALPNDPEKFAYELYYQLRVADQSLAKKIVLELPPNEPQWEAVRERLLKAATKSL